MSTGVKNRNTRPRKTLITVLKPSAKDAREYFLEAPNYCDIELPNYFQFGKLLKQVATVLNGGSFQSRKKKDPKDYESVNHLLYNNKDGKYAWRPLQIIHPAIYVSLVNEITNANAWKIIRSKFREFQQNPNIRCISIPKKSLSKKSNKAEEIQNWWEEIELGSLELSLTYDHTIHTDITDCYGAIYTHSIAWALHSKKYAKVPKNRKNKKLIGNIIDTHIQAMRNGQTNGLPQGSVLMDFIAEMVLGYADVEISEKIATHEIDDYQILRYRDDYRIFTNSSQDGERILKCITEALIEIGMKLGAAKTKLSNSVVEASIKKDKIDWICRKQSEKDLHKHLLIIHNHSAQYPNSGSLVRALSEFHKRLISIKTIYCPSPMIGVLTDIAFHNPRVYPYFAAILSKMLKSLPREEATNFVEKIKSKFDKLPNTGHVQLWLQRITYPFAPSLNFEESLCKLVSGETSSIWNDGWIACPKLRSAIKSEGLIDQKKLSAVPPVISVEEISVFSLRADS